MGPFSVFHWFILLAVVLLLFWPRLRRIRSLMEQWAQGFARRDPILWRRFVLHALEQQGKERQFLERLQRLLCSRTVLLIAAAAFLLFALALTR
jgi:hypothetical protein